MSSNIVIAVDIMGGDFGATPILEGVVAALEEKQGFNLILVGDENVINSTIPSKFKSRVEIVHTVDVITMEDSSTNALKRKESSIYKAVDLVREKRANAIVSAGHSGATMSLATLRIGRLNGVLRPAIATLMPNLSGKSLVLDVGANVDCEEENLFQFAIMGEAYAEEIMGIKSPRIGLISNGEESTKGNKIVKHTHEMLKSMPTFKGNAEGSDIFNGNFDVLVCDGFVGNIILKTSEGVATLIGKYLKTEINASAKSKLGYLLCKGAFNNLKKEVDYDQYGGAPLLGVNGCVIVSHGKSNQVAIKNAIFQALKFANSNINKVIENELEKYSSRG